VEDAETSTAIFLICYTTVMYAVYILTNKTNDVLYVGCTHNLSQRTEVHASKLIPTSFSARYNTVKLVYYELFDNEMEAYRREYQLKNWHREWKRNLITCTNPKWQDLSSTLQP